MLKNLHYWFFRLKAFLSFYREAKTIYQVHSPFFYEFAQEVLEDRRWYYAFSEVESLRKHFLRDRTVLTVQDLGAGSRVQKGAQRQVRQITRHATSSPGQCRQLFRIAKRFRPGAILELGTSFGFSTAYLAAGSRQAQVVTLEGSPEIAAYARRNLEWLKQQQVSLLEGDFDSRLGEVLENAPPIDLVFLDGNHRYEPTVRYFDQILEKTGPLGVWIVDDIHWSEEMEAAWQYIQAHPSITSSIDLFWAGIAFKNPNLTHKTHLKLAPSRWKPWQVGWW